MQAAQGQVRYVSWYSVLVLVSDWRLDRAQPSCGWCTRNGQVCEYKERKKPGLRAGYGKELEQRLGTGFSVTTYALTH